MQRIYRNGCHVNVESSEVNHWGSAGFRAVLLGTLVLQKAHASGSVRIAKNISIYCLKFSEILSLRTFFLKSFASGFCFANSCCEVSDGESRRADCAGWCDLSRCGRALSFE